MVSVYGLGGAEDRCPGDLSRDNAGFVRNLAGRSVIGIVDSGVGGLAIAREIWRQLPGEDTLYLADQRFFPYGNKPVVWIRRRLIKMVDWLIAGNCRVIVIACNTMTAVGIDVLRRRYPVLFIGTEPAVRQGGLVLATPTTAASRRYRKLAGSFPVKTLACPGLAEAIEAGQPIRAFLPPLPQDCRTVVLGCTHYLLVKSRIKRVYGPSVRLIDPTGAIVRRLKQLLPTAVSGRPGRRQFFTTGPSRRFRGIILTKCSI